MTLLCEKKLVRKDLLGYVVECEENQERDETGYT